MRRLLAAAALLAVCGPAAAFDPLGSRADLLDLTPPGQVPLDAELSGGVRCPEPFAGGDISLSEVVRRALCRDPRTRQAWAAASLAAARLGAARAAYLPTLSGSLTRSRTGQSLEQGGSTTRSDSRGRGSQLDLAWNLFDFGQREANVDSARQTLLAAAASQNLSIQTIFLDAANAYFGLLNAQGELAVAQEVERINLQSFLAAEAKHAAGVGDLTSKLQTQTAFAQAILARVRAEGNLRNVQGQLAVSIGEPPLRLVKVDADDANLPDTRFVKSVDALLELAQTAHPELASARARLSSAKARIAVADRAYLPSVSLNAVRSSNDRRYDNASPALDQNDRSVSVQLNVPIFDGFSRHYQGVAARAEFEQADAELRGVEQRVALEVWQAYQTLQPQTLDSTQKLLGYATKSLEVAQWRYKAGVGSTLELLEAQRAMADAAQQRINALATWRATRLRLAASLGKLGFWSVEGS